MIPLLLSLLLAAPTPPIPIPGARKATTAAIIPLRGPIDSITVDSFRRRLDKAAKAGADAIVIELDTPGGELGATLEITNMIRTRAPANTVAWVNPFAFSAGTIIALSAREIVTAPDAMFGDAAPVTPLGPIPATERAKIESPLLAEVIDEARRHHYDERLVQAFVSVGIELWLLRDPATGEVVFVDRKEFRDVYGSEPEASLTPITPPSQGAAFKPSPLLDYLSSMSGEADSMEDDIAAIPQLPPVRGPLTSADADRFEVLGQVVSNDRLLTLKPWQAEAFGLSAGTVADDEAMRRFLGAATVIRIEPQWSEGLVKVLLSWPVRVAFIAIFVICVLIEMALPGTGWFGLGGVAALIVLLGAPMLVGLASWWDVAAVLLGIALIAAEILVIPGTIVAGLCGAVLLLVGLVGSVVSGDLSSISGQEEVVRGGLIVLVGGAIGWIGAWLLLRQFDHASFASPLVLTDEGPRDTPTPTRIGLTGTAITDLRPSGRVRIGGETLDAVCSGRWIEVGAAVRISRDGIVVEVEPLA